MCPQGCRQQMTIFRVEGEGRLMPTLSAPFGAGGAGGVGNLMYPMGGPPPPVQSWMPQIWVRGRPELFPHPMMVTTEGYMPDWD
jgi:hypothetical protein